ncbi:MAG: hypothetical protein FWF46_09365, partial [Oscillospiraceae bacterium]|nr:hypothetical protein [Oscillospiraceae bacterium]
MKKIILITTTIIILVIIAVASYYFINLHISNNNESENAKYFKSLIQYKTNSINDTVNLDKILENTELSKYITKTEKGVEDGKEHLIIYYKGYENDKIGWFYNHENFIIEKNAVVLFALINNLEKITYFDLDTVGPNPSEDVGGNYNRETINAYYNQDVRNYINKPNEFLKYNINTNISHITIYVNEYINNSMQTKKIEVNDNQKTEQISDLIKSQNFGIADNLILGWTNIYVDLNNGYIIGLYDSSDSLSANLGIIVKGNGKEIFENGKGFGDAVTINKTLPEDFRAEIMDIINNSSGEILNTTAFELIYEDNNNNKISVILKKGELPNYDYNIYAYGGNVKIKINNETLDLRDALLTGKINMSDIIGQCVKDAEENKIQTDMYEDGGSMEYRY